MTTHVLRFPAFEIVTHPHPVSAPFEFAPGTAIRQAYDLAFPGGALVEVLERGQRLVQMEAERDTLQALARMDDERSDVAEVLFRTQRLALLEEGILRLRAEITAAEQAQQSAEQRYHTLYHAYLTAAQRYNPLCDLESVSVRSARVGEWQAALVQAWEALQMHLRPTVDDATSVALEAAEPSQPTGPMVRRSSEEPRDVYLGFTRRGSSTSSEPQG